MDIGEQVARMVARRVPRNPDGGLGDLTPAEQHTLYSDLLNEGDRCECGLCTSDCSSPIPGQPKRLA